MATASRTAVFRTLVRDHLRPTTITVAPSETCGAVVERMRQAGASSAVVTDKEGKPAGIVTEQDVCRRMAYRAEGDMPVSRVMSAPVETIEADDYLYRAIARMRGRELRHMPVVDGNGAVLGDLELHRALAAASAATMDLVDRLTRDDSLEGLTSVKTAQVEVADSLLQEGLPAPEVQALLADVNLDLYRRVVRLSLDAMAAEGCGGPPLAFAVIVMGSGGRGESFLFPDQDNGFVLADYPDDEHDRIDRFFIELADRMTRGLDTVGIPLCKGNVMATNPVWRKSLSQWRAQIEIWTRRRKDNMALLADIFFDFRAAAGDPSLARALRDSVTPLAKGNTGFLRALYEIEAEHKVALGLFGRLAPTRTDPEDGSARINMKLQGTLPLVEGVRLLALREGIAAPSTLARIAALHASGILDGDEQDYLRGAFHHISFLLLREQIAAFKAGRPVGNELVPAALTERERDMLVDALKAVRDLRLRVRGEFGADYF
ncbi:MAG: DUF294 nucleotidyltransferase-like domain-containing protein [Alphaproteobacteria bacterium]